jgi:hypothetical protein
VGEIGDSPSSGVAVYERGANGLLTAARIYDDVTPPAAKRFDGRLDALTITV